MGLRFGRVLTIFLIACGEETADDVPPPPADAGVIADGGSPDAAFPHDVVPDPPAAPAAASPPVLTPCPPGWRTVARPDAPTVCDPWPAAGRQSCGPGEAHFPGTAGCAAIGDPCPSGEFLDLGANALYVTASTTAVSGDGSMGAPFTSIAQAIASAPADGFIVLGKGTFDEAFTIDRPVRLVGSCVAETRLTSSIAAINQAVVRAAAIEAELRGVTISGQRIGILVESGRLRAHELAVEAARQVGIRVGGGEATLEEVVIRDIQPAADEGLGFGHGINARNGGQIAASRLVVENAREIGIALRGASPAPHRFTDVAVVGTQIEGPLGTGRALNVADPAHAIFERAVFEDSREVGVAVAFDATIELTDVVIRRARGIADGRLGVGMAVNVNSLATGRRIWVTGNAHAGIAVGSDPPELSTVELEDLVVEDTTGDEAGEFGRGFEVGFGGSARLRRVWVRNNRLHGLHVDGTGSSLTATDAFSLETLPEAIDGSSGWGAQATRGASLYLERAVLARNAELGAGFANENTRVVLRDLVVEDTAPGDVVGPCGRGLNAQEGVRLIIERARLSRNREVGIVIHDPTTIATLTDIVVEDTATVTPGILGSGIGVQLGAQMELTRAVVSNSGECGVFAHDEGALLSLTDVAIRNGRGTPRFGTFGRGINVQTGARLTGSRVLIESNREAGAVIANAGSELTLSDSTVRGTLQRRCAATTCPNEGAGSGIVVRDSGHALLSRFLLSDNFLAGAQISEGATIDLMDGDVVNHPVGVNVQTPGFDNNRVLDGVRYIDNAVQVNGASLFVPSNEASVVPQ